MRLRDGRAISSTLRHGDRSAGRFVALHVRVRPATTQPSRQSGWPDEAVRGEVGRLAVSRVAVVASKKVGGAVARNRAKRLLREAVHRAAVPPSSDSVLVARPGCGEARAQDVVSEVAVLYERLPHIAAGK